MFKFNSPEFKKIYISKVHKKGIAHVQCMNTIMQSLHNKE